MTYEILDELFLDRLDAINYLQKSFLDFQSIKIDKILYSGNSQNYLGNENPSLFLQNDKKFFKKKPSYNEWAVYEYNLDGMIQRISHFSRINGKEICDCTYHFFEKNGFMYAVPCIGKDVSPYPCYIFKYQYQNEKISYVAYIDEISLWLELYDWDNEICEVWHYVPGRINSDKKEPIGSEKSPAHKKVESLNKKIDSFSEKSYKLWLKNNFNLVKDKKEIFISIGENSPNTYSVGVLVSDGETECMISEAYFFTSNLNWKHILEKLYIISKAYLKVGEEKIVYIGFCDGDTKKL